MYLSNRNVQSLITSVLLVLFLGLVFIPSRSSANEDSPPHEQSWRGWPVVGQAQLSWLFFDVYQSELLSPKGEYLVSQDVTPHPMALRIKYQRNISKKQLLEATAEQWQKMGYSRSKNSTWIEVLSGIFPSIEDGDELVYVTDGSAGTFYYYRGTQQMLNVGSIVDEELNDAFLAIWLSPKSEYPKLRAQLIGAKR
jgi:hypothetical protein